MSATCSSCEAAIIWAVTAAGALSPFDAEPTPEGTWLLTKSRSSGDVRATFAGRPGSDKPERREAEAAGRNFYRSHFATCPNAASHRRPTQEVTS